MIILLSRRLVEWMKYAYLNHFSRAGSIPNNIIPVMIPIETNAPKLNFMYLCFSRYSLRVLTSSRLSTNPNCFENSVKLSCLKIAVRCFWNCSLGMTSISVGGAGTSLDDLLSFCTVENLRV